MFFEFSVYFRQQENYSYVVHHFLGISLSVSRFFYFLGDGGSRNVTLRLYARPPLISRGT